jgi:hypothetical protein
MEMNAFRFFGEAKKVCPALKRFFLEAEDGFIKVARISILPVFCIPTDKGKWPRLAPILLGMIESVHDGDWVSRFKQKKSVDPNIYEEWGDIVDPPPPQKKRDCPSAVPTPDATPSATKNQAKSMAVALLSSVPHVETSDPIPPVSRVEAVVPPGEDQDELMDEEENNVSAENGS